MNIGMASSLNYLFKCLLPNSCFEAVAYTFADYKVVDNLAAFDSFVADHKMVVALQVVAQVMAVVVAS